MSPIVYRPKDPREQPGRHRCLTPPVLPQTPEDYRRWAGMIWQCDTCYRHWQSGAKFWTADPAWLPVRWWDSAALDRIIRAA